jgi:hypothetical protein
MTHPSSPSSTTPPGRQPCPAPAPRPAGPGLPLSVWPWAGHDMPASEAGYAGRVEVTFSPAEPKLTPGAARAVLAMLLRAREAADRAEDQRT